MSSLTVDRVRTEHGAVLVLFAVAMIALLSLCALAIDYGVKVTARGQAQNAADAGALAGAIALSFDDPDEGSLDLSCRHRPVRHDWISRFKRPVAASRTAFRGVVVRSASAAMTTTDPGGRSAWALRKISRRSRLARDRTVAFPARRPMARTSSFPA